ncbi:MAG: LuxR C-terminal-related transcriptional regulator [Enterobacter sp.]|jgi:DNA-binding CsgD family transcriptional regulator|nr:LuxR C-terminal-related transcriptional regulator [Enterobacter sp.]
MPKNNFKRALLCESRLLYRSAARYSLEENAYSVLEISPHQLLEEACGYNGKDQLIVIGIGGVGSEIRTLLQAIYRLTFFTSNIIVSLPGDNGHLSVFMKGLGVSHIIPEDLLCETLSTYINVASVLPSRSELTDKSHYGLLAGRISTCELNTLLDFSRGMSANEIASFRHISYKTVFTHKRNVALRMNIKTSLQWLELLVQIEKIHSL